MENKANKSEPLLDLNLHTTKPFIEGLLKHMHAGVFICNKDIISFFNKAAEWITGYCSGDVIGKNCRDVFKSKKSGEECLFENVLRTGRPIYKTEINIVGKDGKDIPISTTAFSLKDEQGNTIGIVGIFRDISEVKTLRGQLLQSDKLAIMGQLAAGVAHEINNPISGILIYIKLIYKMLGQKEVNIDDFRRYLKIMERETARVGRTVKNLLDFTRPKEPEIIYVDIDEVIEQSLLLLEDPLRVGDIEVQRECTNRIPKIMGDFGQLQQVFMNIMLNACQAMPKGGKLTISRTVEGKPGDESFVSVKISDTGYGIPKKDIPKIFGPFFTTKGGKNGIGLGLGLSIVQNIIQIHHGKIDVESEVGKGTAFTIRLPT